MPGRFMAASIRCIQFSPVIRTSSRTNASRPQKVTKTLVLMPLAAAVDDRMRTGQTRSRSPLQLTITSSLTRSAPGLVPSSSVSGRAAGTVGVGASIVPIIVGTSSLSQYESEDGTVNALLDQRIPGRPRPRRKVLDRPGVRGEHLQRFAGTELLHRLGRLDDRHRAGETPRVELAGDLDGH